MNTYKDITFITAYFKINNNKYNSDYMEWMNNLLSNLNAPLVIYTTPDLYKQMIEMRIGYENKTKVIFTDFPDFYVYKYLDYFKKDLERDREKYIHNIFLYMIWNEKLNFIKKTIHLNPFQTSYYAWCDIGYVRNPIYIDKYLKKGFPNLNRLIDDKIHMLQFDYEFTSNDFKNPYYGDWSTVANLGGGFIIGKYDKLLEMANIYYQDIMPTYISKNLFIGKDQNLYTSIYLKYPHLFKLIKGINDNYNIPFCELRWFYFLHYLT
jgi:hypothetical protein